MGRRLYVGNLPFSAGETELQELFGQAGNVDNVKVMRDMATDEEAQAAIDKFHNHEFGGRNLTVNEARPRENRGGGFGGGGNGFGGGGFGGGRDGGGGSRRGGGGRREPRW